VWLVIYCTWFQQLINGYVLKPQTSSGHRQEELLVHEIIFASRDKPGLLSQVMGSLVLVLSV
jgi:hypothetical protein